MKDRINSLELPPGIELVYYQASLTAQNKKRTKFVKIATSGEVQVDVRLRNGEFKSQYFSLNTVCDTVECFASQVQKQFPALAVI